jgi:Kef-type K+ transport system membrane component KefB/mannitol/fructose-specific phosphotransferase system IIA component
MDEHAITILLLSLAVLLAGARVAGELCRHLGQPAILGEILVGIVLGPTVFGALFPGASAWLFHDPASAQVRQGFGQVAVCLFMLVAGLEVDLGAVARRGLSALGVSLSGIVIPFAVGFATAYAWPDLLGGTPGIQTLHFALFFATALSISALPVIAKTLMDLGLFRSDIGMVVISAAIVEDLIGWIVFALVLGLIGTGATHTFSPGGTAILVVCYAVGMLTIGRWLLNRILPAAYAYLSWPGGVLGLVLVLDLLCAAFTEWIGVHAIFGSFLLGIALGDSRHLRGRTRATLEHFISFFFAPIFFASIGLRVDCIRNFDGILVTTVLVVACIGKVLGAGLGARWGGLPWRESWAIGFAMNARGAMEIILGLLALQYHLITEAMFVALVIMALVTSLMSGPAVSRILRRIRPARLADMLGARTFAGLLRGRDSEVAIRELVACAAAQTTLDPAVICQAVIAREREMPTGMGNGVAVPHARLAGLAQPVLAVGLSDTGIDFGAPDGRPIHVVVLLLTPQDDHAMQIELLAEIAEAFRDGKVAEQAVRVRGHTEFLALIKAGSSGGERGRHAPTTESEAP